MQKNDSHPALLRAGDTDPSTSYELCFRHGSIERDWKNLGHVQERKSNELCLSQKTGVNYLRIMRIEVHQDGKQPRGVGVLGAGFEARPDDCGKVDEILRRWAQSDKSEFVDYLEEHFQLGGPILKS